jgi:hypothetical protein
MAGKAGGGGGGGANKAEHPVHSLGVALAAVGPTHAFVSTADGQFFTWPLPAPAQAATDAKGKAAAAAKDAKAKPPAAAKPAPANSANSALASASASAPAEARLGSKVEYAEGETLNPYAPLAVPWLRGLEAERLCAGGPHTPVCVVIGRGGEAHEWHAETNAVRRVFAHLSVASVAYGQEGGHFFVLTTDGALLACGEPGKSGVLGFPDKKERTEPERIPGLEGVRVVQVAAGAAHTLALSESGALYVWGGGEAGALGVGDKKGRAVPVLLENFPPAGEKVVGIAAGAYHSLALTDSGRVYSWGRCAGGVLGHGDTKDATVDAPRRVAGLGSGAGEEAAGGAVVSIAAGMQHSVAATSSGVFTWGRGARGVLGHGTEEDVSVPKLVEALAGRSLVEGK